MKFIKLTFIITAILFFTMCTAQPKQKVEKEIKDLNNYSVAYFASGCFWCVEAIFESVEGVIEAESGYSGGKEQNPTYKQVSAGLTGHTESVKVYYDANIIDYKTLLRVYYGSHNPTTVNGQHPDYGKQYRSAIFYTNDDEKAIIENYINELESLSTYKEEIATEVVMFDKFWIAEDYHQDYEKLNPNQPYVKSVSIPRLRKFQAAHKDLLKKENH